MAKRPINWSFLIIGALVIAGAIYISSLMPPQGLFGVIKNWLAIPQ